MIEVYILGVRHHGPGSARSVATALEALQPDVILLEGLPDAQELISLLITRKCSRRLRARSVVRRAEARGI